MSQLASSGYHLEDFELGRVFHSPMRTVTEADVVHFAGISGDYNPLHTDVEFASHTPFGQRIAHGLLGLAIASGLAARTGLTEGTVDAFTGLSWKFKAPIFFGDSIRLEARVARVRAMPSRGNGMVILVVTLINQRDETVQEGEWSLLVRCRPPSDIH